MKKITILLMAVFSVATLYSQTETFKKNTVEVYIAPSYGTLYGFGIFHYGIGIDYSRSLTEHWSLCGGIERNATTNNYKTVVSKEQVGDKVSINATIKKGLFFKWEVTSIPVQLKYYFRKTVYINFGPSLDLFNEPNDPDGTKAGLGWRAGVGFEHEFSNGITLSLNPYLKANFGSWNNYYQLAVNLGVAYRF